MSCPFKDIFGKPGEGAHSIRIFDIAVVDTLLTILGAFGIHKLLPGSNFWVVLVVLFILGIILHRLFCVRTTIDKLLFNS